MPWPCQHAGHEGANHDHQHHAQPTQQALWAAVRIGGALLGKIVLMLLACVLIKQARPHRTEEVTLR